MEWYRIYRSLIDYGGKIEIPVMFRSCCLFVCFFSISSLETKLINVKLILKGNLNLLIHRLHYKRIYFAF